MNLLTWWRGLSLGLLLIAVAAILHDDHLTWHWMFVVLAAMSFVNALLKKRWRWAVQPLMWCLGLGFAYSTPAEGQPGHIGGWTMFFALCGASLVLSFLIGLIPQRPETRAAAPPPRPGSGIVIDVTPGRPGDGA